MVVCETTRLVPIREIATSPDISNELRIRVNLSKKVRSSFAKMASFYLHVKVGHT